MKIKVYVIDLEIAPRTKRRAMLVGIPVGLLFGGSAVLYASVPNQFSPGQVISSSQMNENFADLDTRLATVEVSTDCPAGYARDLSLPNIVLCVNGNDEVVKVGLGASAFWIDRFEASVWSDPAGTMGFAANVPYGATFFAPDYPATFPQNGQVTSASGLLYAVSRAGVPPSRDLTWFQADLACRASGKRLPRGSEWLAGATGTIDPDASDGTNGACLTQGTAARNTGAVNADVNCASLWGAEDMIGNLEEWNEEWYPGGGDSTVQTPIVAWPASYNEDITFNVSSQAISPIGTVLGTPAGGSRGGGWEPGFNGGTRAGVFYLNLNVAPSFAGGFGGFRCVVPR